MENDLDSYYVYIYIYIYIISNRNMKTDMLPNY